LESLPFCGTPPPFFDSLRRISFTCENSSTLSSAPTRKQPGHPPDEILNLTQHLLQPLWTRLLRRRDPQPPTGPSRCTPFHTHRGFLAKRSLGLMFPTTSSDYASRTKFMGSAPSLPGSFIEAIFPPPPHFHPTSAIARHPRER